jgi:hypothetical protein
MHRLTLVAIGLVVLTTAGIAVAKGLDNAKTVTSVSGTFDAATVQHRGKARTCTTTDGTTLVTTNARYTGTAAGDGALAGGITIDARSTIDTTDNLGVVEGKLRIDVTSGADTTARFTAVYAAGKLGGADGGSAVALGPGKCAPKHDKATAPKRPGPHDHGDKKGKDD